MDELLQLIAAVNAARRRGATDQELDTILQEEKGMSLSDLQSEVRTFLKTTAEQTPEEREREIAKGVEEQAKPGDVAAAAAHGATFGLIDEALTGLSFLQQQPVLADIGTAMRERTERLRRTNPKQALAAEVAGGLLVPGGAAASAARGGMGVVSSAARGAAVGAGGGLLAAAGEASGLEEFKQTAPWFTGGGAAIGFAVPFIPAAFKVAREMSDVFHPTSAGRRRAVEEIQRAAFRSGKKPQELVETFQEMQRVRPGLGVPADVDKQFKNLVRAKINEASGDVEDIVQRVSGRTEAAGERIADDVRRLSGFGDEPAKVAQEAVEGRVLARGRELFGAFDNQIVDVSDPRIVDLMNDPDFAAAWKKTRPLGGKDEPVFQHFQQLRNRLKGEADAAAQSGNKFLAGKLRGHADELTSAIEDQMPGFRAANLEYYQTQRAVQAFDMGAKAIKRNMPGRTIEAELAELAAQAGDHAEEALRAYRHGYVDQMLLDLLNKNTNRNVGAGFRHAGPEKVRALRKMFPSRKAFDDFIAGAVAEDEFSVLKNIALGNSTTASQITELTRSQRTGFFWGARAMIANFITRPNEEINRSLSNTVAEILLSPGDEAIQKFAGLLSGRAAGAQHLAGVVGVSPALARFTAAIRGDRDAERRP